MMYALSKYEELLQSESEIKSSVEALSKLSALVFNDVEDFEDE